MRGISSLILLGALAVTSAAGQDFPVVSAQDAQQLGDAVGLFNGPRGRVVMFIWSDKYVYEPAQTLTLKWTVKTNNDLYPYTVFLYRQNNQTGAKTYYPAGTAAVTDINGNTQAQGFQPQQLQDRTKAVLLGAGGIAPGVSIPSEAGMHTFVVEFRDYTGSRVLKAGYMKIGVVTKTETLSGGISADKTLTNDTLWNLQGLVFVKNAVLTIQPGTFIYGLPGTAPNTSGLVITRTATIEASGTAARPIVLTSSLAFGQRSRGNWAGLIVLGRAPVNLAAGASENNPAGEGYIEGLQTTPDGLYGGTDPTHYCGTMTYMRVEFAGVELSPANEVNAFTWGGCGTKTVAHHLQASYGRDDSFEWFGGTMNTSHLVGGLGADDCLDYQLGTAGKVQFAICYQSPDQNGARGVEGDNSQFNELAVPVSNPTFYNVTLLGIDATGTEDNPTVGLFLRWWARGSFNNFVIQRWRGAAVLFNNDSSGSTLAQANGGFIKMNGILVWNGNLGGTPANTLAGNIGTGTGQTNTLNFLQGSPAGGAQNIVVADPLLARPFEYSDPDFKALFASPIFRAGWVQPPDDGFFDPAARFVGGIGDYDWTEGWTMFVQDVDMI